MVDIIYIHLTCLMKDKLHINYNGNVDMHPAE